MILRVIKYIFVFIILTAVVVGSSGINILVHDCSGSKKTDFVSYPELHKADKGSCCSLVYHSSQKSTTKGTTLKKAACCKLNTYRLKVNPYEIQYTTQASVLISPELPSLLVTEDLVPTDDNSIIACNSPPSKVPDQRSGKELVFFISQLRIPASC